MSKYFIALLALLAFPANAQQECIAIPSDDERLACYDLAFGVLEQETEAGAGNGKWNKA